MPLPYQIELTLKQARQQLPPVCPLNVVYENHNGTHFIHTNAYSLDGAVAATPAGMTIASVELATNLVFLPRL